MYESNSADDWVAAGLEFDVEKWYPHVAHLTPQSKIFELNKKEITSIVEFYAMEFNLRRDGVTDRQLLEEGLISIADKLREAMKSDDRSFCWFVRLSCRSPKDGIAANSVESSEHELLSRVNANHPGKEPITVENLASVECPLIFNEMLIESFSITAQSLAVRNPYEALHLLCSSERVFRDLKKTLQHGYDRCQLMLRELNREIHCTWEFRCFIRNGILNAISQYNHYVYIKEFRDEVAAVPERKVGGIEHSPHRTKKQFIWETISRFHTSNKGCIPYNDCVMDVAILHGPDAMTTWTSGEGNEFPVAEVILIEFNPFDKFTGPCLFHWDRDAFILNTPPLLVTPNMAQDAAAEPAVGGGGGGDAAEVHAAGEDQGHSRSPVVSLQFINERVRVREGVMRDVGELVEVQLLQDIEIRRKALHRKNVMKASVNAGLCVGTTDDSLSILNNAKFLLDCCATSTERIASANVKKVSNPRSCSLM
jgi:hypothetical protein